MSHLWGVHSTTFEPELRNESFALISFTGFPAVLSALQPFQICIFNRKYSNLTSSWHWANGEKVYGKFACIIGTVHAKVEFQNMSMTMRCQIQGGGIPQLFILNSEMNLKIFSNPGGVHSMEWAYSQDLTLFPFFCCASP